MTYDVSNVAALITDISTRYTTTLLHLMYNGLYVD